MRLILLFFVAACSLSAVAQTFQTLSIRGRVVDAVDGDAVPRASVFIENHDHIGVTTDDQGFFILTIPSSIQDDFIVVSALGFAKKKASVEAIRNEAVTTFKMDRMSIMLDEVVITDKSYDLEGICKEAVKRIPQNYPNSLHFLTGLYRKLSSDSTQYTGLVEAVVGIRDPGYKESTEAVQVQVYEVRYSDNALKPDTLAMKVANKVSEKYGESSSNSFHRFYESNLVRLYNKPFTFFNKEGKTFTFAKDYNGVIEKAELQNITIDHGDTILHILVESFAQKRFLDAIQVSINLDDLSIVEFTRGLFDDKVTVKFKRDDHGTYYPYFIKLIRPTMFKANGKQGLIDIETLWIDGVETSSKKVPKLKYKEDRLKSFEPRGRAYDPSFWANYYIEHPTCPNLDDDVIRSLERFEPLREQFKRRPK